MELILVHLTDIHISGEDDKDILLSRTDSIVGAIAEVIKKPSETLLLICVTGDISNSGMQKQYEVAYIFFTEIAKKIKERYNESLWFQYSFVPGNHDCDFSDSKATIRTSLIQNKNLDIENKEIIKSCNDIQNNFFEFLQRLSNQGLCSKIRNNDIFTENILFNEANPNMAKWRIKLHCINTAWCSQLHEDKNIRVAIPTDLPKEKNDIVITMMHHGPNWFDWDSNNLWDTYHREYSDIILVGHDHKLNFLQEKNYDSSTNYFIRGNQLYNNNERDKSGFNILKINLEDNIEIFYSYSWKGEVFERSICSEPKIFERNKYKDSSINLRSEVKEYLEEIEVDIVNKYKKPILLSDIYVFPVLQGEICDKPEKTKTYRGREEIIEVISAKKRVIIDGGKEYGKTAFIKSLFTIFFDENTKPIILRGEEIKSADEYEINAKVRELYLATYTNVNIDIIMQMDKQQRVLLIDDFDANSLPDKSQKQFLEYICSQFGMVIATHNSKNNIVESVKNIMTSSYFDSEFYSLKIVTMRRVMKNDIIQKWLLLEDSSQNVHSIEFQNKVKEKNNKVNSIIKNGYFSDTPIDFLLVLSYIDNAQSISSDYSKYSYIYDSLIKERINQIAEQDTMLCSAYITLLQLLAYELYIHGQGELFEENYLINAIYKYNEQYTPFKTNITQIIKRLLDYQILLERNSKYKFRFSYMYYYFVGSYIDQVMSPKEKSAKISEILSDLALETNFNIALFIAYSTSTEYIVLPIAEEIEKKLLKEYEGYSYEDVCKLIGNMNESILKKVNIFYEIPENSDIPNIQRRVMELKDEMDEIETSSVEEISDTEKKEREQFELIFNDFTKLLRLIQFEGEVLKNYAPRIKNQPRAEMIELMANSTMKLIGFFGKMISTELNNIIKVVEQKVRLNYEVSNNKLDKSVLVQLIKDYMYVIWSQFVEVIIANLVICWDTDMITQDIYNIKVKKKSTFFDMVNISYQFKISNSKLPVRDIEKCLEGKEKLDSFSILILKKIIAYYLMNNQYDSVEKEKVCAVLGFNYRALYVEEKKQEAFGMNK